MIRRNIFRISDNGKVLVGRKFRFIRNAFLFAEIFRHKGVVVSFPALVKMEENDICCKTGSGKNAYHRKTDMV